LSVNGNSYGQLKSGDTVVVDHGQVRTHAAGSQDHIPIM
jgi:hypothetical protein